MIRFTLWPRENELLTSWVARYALGMGLSPYSFLKYFFECPKISILDYDRFIKEDNKKLFSNHSGINESEINSHTIIQYARKIIDVSSEQNYYLYRDILPKSKLRIAGQMYCPLCLVEDPYYRISWRLTLIIACPVHKIRLVNRCPHCNEPIRLELLNCFLKNVAYCFSCWRSLTVLQSLKPAHEEVLAFTQNLYDGLEFGSVYLNEETELFAPVWLSGIWALINTFYSKRKGINYLQSACDFFGIKPKASLSNSKNYKRFGSEKIEARYLVIRLLGLILKDWPNAFTELGKSIGLSKCVVNPRGIELAYWLHQVCNKELHTYYYRVTDDEIISALGYMIKNKIKITRSGLARLLGNDESMKLNIKRRDILRKYQSQQNVD